MIKSRHIRAKAGKLRLWFNPKNNKWDMTGGKWGKHCIYSNPVYNERVAGHWRGYIENNGEKYGPGSHGGLPIYI